MEKRKRLPAEVCRRSSQLAISTRKQMDCGFFKILCCESGRILMPFPWWAAPKCIPQFPKWLPKWVHPSTRIMSEAGCQKWLFWSNIIELEMSSSSCHQSASTFVCFLIFLGISFIFIIQSFTQKYCLSAYYGPGTVLGSRNAAVEKWTKNVYPQGLHSSYVETDVKISK